MRRPPAKGRPRSSKHNIPSAYVVPPSGRTRNGRRAGPAVAGLGVAALPLLTGCEGSPALPIAGAFFPAWLACAVVGVAAAIAARIVFVATGLSTVLPYQLAVCLSIGLIIALLVWLLWIGF